MNQGPLHPENSGRGEDEDFLSGNPESLKRELLTYLGLPN